MISFHSLFFPIYDSLLLSETEMLESIGELPFFRETEHISESISVSIYHLFIKKLLEVVTVTLDQVWSL